MKRNYIQFLGLALLVLLMLGVRLTFYEPLDRSVSAHDTERYIPVTSESFASNSDGEAGWSGTTVTLVYKLLQPKSGYEITNLSSPGDSIHPSLSEQTGFRSIVIAQTILSTFAWVSLALVVFKNLQKPIFKWLCAMLVLLFGFVPQMAEWDYVMLSEPISTSLFVLLLALALEIVARVSREKKSSSRSTYGLLGLWLVLVTAWVFTRDSNAYLLPAILLAFALLIAWKPIRNDLPMPSLVLIGALLILLFLIAGHTLQISGRWESPFFNNLLVHILPNSEYSAFFEARGMPITDKVRALIGSPLTQPAFFEIDYLVAWVQKQGTSTYMQFIITHPSWALETVLTNSAAVFGESTQPFFSRNPDVTPDSMFYFGRLMHPVNTSLFFIAVAQIIVFTILAFQLTDPTKKAIAGLFVVLFIGELVILVVSILGDASNIVRHTMGAVMPMRLSLWLLPLFILDTVFSHDQGAQKSRKAPHGRMPKKKRS